MIARKQVDLVLVNPGNRERIYQGLGKEMAAIEPPIWAAIMATYARRKGLDVVIVDAEAEEWSSRQTALRVIEINPRLIAVVIYGQNPSASTQVMPGAGAVCRAIKELDPAQKVMMLGGHVAALPQRTMDEESIDFVGGGEGLVTLVELIQVLRRTDNPASSDLARVHDLWHRAGDHVVHGPPASLVNDLSGEIPTLAWDLLPIAKYRAHNWHALGYPSRQPYAAIYTTLGCPYKCSFCCIQAPFKSGEAAAGMKATVNSYRFWEPRLVVDQLEMLAKEHGVTHVKFADEMFVLTARHVAAICDEIVARGLKLNIWAYARIDTVKDGLLPKLKAAGFNWLAFGIEAANERVRNDVQKGYAQAEIRATLAKVRDAGINVMGNYIFGLPEDDMETMGQTLELAMDLNTEFANFYSAMAYPGSGLYQGALKDNLPLPATWAGYSQHAVDTLPLPTRHLSAGEVLAYRDQAFQTYFTNPRYLEMVGRKLGAEAVAQVMEMTGHKLERRYSTAPPAKTQATPAVA